MTAATDCVFCEIVAGRAPASVVYADEQVTAFLDIQPVTPGHLLVIPNAHLPSLADLTDDVAGHLVRIARRLAAALRAADPRCEGINLFVADGEAAWQEVFHHHLHVIPRWPGDGFLIGASAWDAPPPSRAELEAAAFPIRAALARGNDPIRSAGGEA
jgi:histidine triad (HIT) family protein